MANANERPHIVYLTKREIQVLANACRVAIKLRQSISNDVAGNYLDTLSPELDELFNKFRDKYRELGGSNDNEGK